jgi:hypothetical protein
LGNSPLDNLLTAIEKSSQPLRIDYPAMIVVLLDAGAHIDARDAFCMRPLERLWSNPRRVVSCATQSYAFRSSRCKYPGIRPLRYLSLQCFAARVIRSAHIPYRNKVPPGLTDFIDMH